MKNHSAFPHGQVIKEDSVVERCEGMTLLDYFAGQALAGLWADPSSEMLMEDAAESVYNMASAMLAERERRLNG